MFAPEPPLHDRPSADEAPTPDARLTPASDVHEALAARARQQSAVAALGVRALGSRDLAALLQDAVETVSRTLDNELVKVLELLPDASAVRLVAGVGWREGLLGQATVGVGLDSQAGYTLKSNEPVIVEDLRDEARFSGPPLLHEHGVVSGMSVIIHGAEGRPYGVLGTHTARRRLFTRDDVHFLQAVANVLGAAVQRRQVEAELAARAREAEAARREAEVANLAKSEFLAVMSHELRTPLNAIGGYAELIELGVRGAVTEAQREDLARIRRSQRHLLRLMDDVLDFAGAGAGTLRFDPTSVPLTEALADLEALVGPELAAKSLAWDRSACPPGLTVHADRERLLQILTHLVSNSIKFTPSGGRVTVDCAIDGAAVRIRVADTGIGIPPAQLERVFQPFTQLDVGLRRTKGGTGLGLSISRGLAEAMGGTLTAESPPDGGAVLTLALPQADARDG